MNASLHAVLSDTDRLLVAETELAKLAPLDEDAAVELHTRIRRARNKYVGQYRRGASARVVEEGARGTARPTNRRAALKAEAFEEALARVSRRLAILARQSAAQLRLERIQAARSGTKSHELAAGKAAPASRPSGSALADDRAISAPARQKRRATARATGARKQARRDSR